MTHVDSLTGQALTINQSARDARPRVSNASEPGGASRLSMDPRPTMHPSFLVRRAGSKAQQENVSRLSLSERLVTGLLTRSQVRLQTEARGPVQRIAPEQQFKTPTPSPRTPTPHQQLEEEAGGVASWSPERGPSSISPYVDAAADTSAEPAVLFSPPEQNSHRFQPALGRTSLPNSEESRIHQEQPYWHGDHPTTSTQSSEHDGITIQEACLLKHFIDKLSHWVSSLNTYRIPLT